MIPSFFVQLEKIPLTPNGKVDRRALPVPEFAAGGGYMAPANEIEEKLIGIWSTVLKIERENVSVTANFFELGGHSIKATVMAAMIHKVFEVKVPLAELFRLQTPRELAGFIRQAKKVSFIDIEPVEKKEFYELSYSIASWKTSVHDKRGRGFRVRTHA
jgi:acyl carrier protein